MKAGRVLTCGAVLVAAVSTGAPAGAGEAAGCKSVHATMVEARSTTACRVGHASCFVGEVDGNHGLRGRTYFRADPEAARIPSSPEFVGYSGVFEYITERGTLTARETGVTSTTQQAVTAHQRIVDATGEYAGATGYFFVSGRNTGQHVVTRLFGEICRP